MILLLPDTHEQSWSMERLSNLQKAQSPAQEHSKPDFPVQPTWVHTFVVIDAKHDLNTLWRNKNSDSL